MQPLFLDGGREFSRRCSTCFPFQLKHIVVAYFYAHQAGEEALLDYLAFQQQLVSEYNTKGNCSSTIGCVSGYSLTHTLLLLQERGYHRQCVLVMKLGGMMDLDSRMQKWIRGRLSVENCTMMAAPPILNSTLTNKSNIHRASALKRQRLLLLLPRSRAPNSRRAIPKNQNHSQ